MIRTVAHFIDTRAFAGAERALLHLMQALDRQRWRSILLHHDEPGLRPLLDAADAAGVERRRVAPMRGPGGLLALPAFVRTLRAERPHLLHAHLNWPLACSGGIIAARLSGTPVVATLQLFSPVPRALTIPLQRRVVPRLVGRYIAVSRAMADQIGRDLRVSSRRIQVVPNSIPPDASDTMPPVDACVRAVPAGGPDRPVVLTLARLDRQKGLSYLLHAAAQVSDAAFVIAGEGPERSALEAEARQLGVADRVRFVGFRSDTRTLLANADLFVLPSTIEGLPLSVLEAMAMERPVVATDIPGTSEAVEDGVTGVLVPPADSRALAAAIQRLLNDRPLAARLARNGREAVRQRFSAQSMACAVMTIYDELLADNEGRRRQ